MNPGDRVIAKENFGHFKKGDIARIHSFDYTNDAVILMTPDRYTSCSNIEFLVYFDVLHEPPAIPCPDTLKSWILATKPFIKEK